MKANNTQITNAFLKTKRTSTKVISNINEIYDNNKHDYVYFVTMEDGSKYIYCYECTDQHNYGYAPKYYDRIIKVK